MERDRGFIGYIVLIIIALAALKYFFDWSIFDAAASEEGRATIDYVKNVLSFIWKYLSVPVNYIWGEVLQPLLKWAISSLTKNS